MMDSAIVASIVAGESEGLAAAYDKYADDLYGYCRSMLREPDDAADAVQDTFLVAASKLAGLREPERLRAWLFSVARNECLHRLRSRRAARLDEVPEQPDDSVDVGAGPERAETVALVRAAVGGLNAGERDVINQLWHGLEVPEVAAVLGVSRNHAYVLFSRAREQLEASVAVLLVGRAGRRDCATLDSLLGDWDGRVTTLLRKRVSRHIDRCAVCSDRRRREFTPAMLYGLSAGAVLGMGALGGGVLRANPWAFNPVGQTAAVQVSATGRAAMPMRGDGFPRPVHHGHLGVLHAGPVHVAAAGTATAAAATAVVLVVSPSPRQVPPQAGGPPPGFASASASGSNGTGHGTGGPAAPGARRASHAAATSPGAAGSPGATSSAGLPGSSQAKSGTSRTGGTSGTARATTASGGGSAAAASSGSAASSGTAAAVGTAAASAAQGTLSVSPTTVLLTPLLGGTLTLTASGGPVAWSVSEPASLIGKLNVSPSSGTLAAGSSVTLTITVSGLASVDSELTVSPGGQVVTVLLGLG